MKYETAAAFRTALEQRLLTVSRKQGIPLVRLRKIVVFDRLLARLGRAAPDRWVLKGGLALDFRLGSRARTTKDMDLARQDDEESALADLLAAQELDLGDYFVFRSERVADPGPATEVSAVRFRVHAELAARLFEIVLIDMGFSDPELWEPERLRGPPLLDFAGIEPAEVPALALEQHIAEKVHAYTREYPGGHSSTRVKDLADLALVAAFDTLDADRLRRALDVVFATRGTHPLPDRLPPPPRTWARPFERLVAELEMGSDLESAHADAAALADPVLAGQARGRWDPTKRAWREPTPAS